MKRNNNEFVEKRNTRSLFYIRARYSYAVVVKENIKDNIKEFMIFDPGKLTNKWLKQLYSPKFTIIPYLKENKFVLGDSIIGKSSKNKHIFLNVYFYNNSQEAYDFLTGMIAINTLNQSIDCLNDWVNESLNVDQDKLREKVKALLDMIDNYPANYKLVK